MRDELADRRGQSEGIPAEHAARLAELQAQIGAVRAGRRPHTAETARDAVAEAARHAQDTAHLWAALSLAVCGRDDQVRDSLAVLAGTDPDLVVALAAAADTVAAACRDITKGTRG